MKHYQTSYLTRLARQVRFEVIFQSVSQIQYTIWSEPNGDEVLCAFPHTCSIWLRAWSLFSCVIPFSYVIPFSVRDQTHKHTIYEISNKFPKYFCKKIWDPKFEEVITFRKINIFFKISKCRQNLMGQFFRGTWAHSNFEISKNGRVLK